MRKISHNQKGSALVGTAFVIFVYGMAAISLSHSVATEGGNSYNAYSESHALYVGQAGLEYAKRELDQGEIPDVIGKSFNNGTYPFCELSDIGESMGKNDANWVGLNQSLD